MYLRDVELDLPYNRNELTINSFLNQGYSVDESIKKDYDINWKKKRHIFKTETRCISSLFSRLLGKIKTDDSKKIIVECCSIEPEVSIKNYSGILTTQVFINFKNYESSDNQGKKRIALTLLYKGISYICEKKKWDLTPFSIVNDLMVSSNYINEWFWKRPVFNSNRELSAQLYFKHDLSAFDVYLFIRRKTTVIQKSLLISEEPHELFYANLLGELKWLTNNDVVLETRDKEKRFSLHID
jgi:hypothetical protein